MGMKLFIPIDITRQMYSVVYETAFKTGVTLFGEKEGENFTVAAIAGPGPRVKTQEGSHYSGNEEYARMIFNDLLKDKPNLKHIGNLHVHPFKTTRLSVGELRTVKEFLKEYEEFISGVILRNHFWDFKVFPVYFSRSDPEGTEMKVQFEGRTFRRYRSGFRRKGRR